MGQYNKLRKFIVWIKMKRATQQKKKIKDKPWANLILATGREIMQTHLIVLRANDKLHSKTEVEGRFYAQFRVILHDKTDFSTSGCVRLFSR